MSFDFLLFLRFFDLSYVQIYEALNRGLVLLPTGGYLIWKRLHGRPDSHLFYRLFFMRSLRLQNDDKKLRWHEPYSVAVHIDEYSRTIAESYLMFKGAV